MASKMLVLVLVLIAAVVSAMQYAFGRKNHGVMWGLIVAYWAVLTIKNICDLVGW